jgi:hypothetical protein
VIVNAEGHVPVSRAECRAPKENLLTTDAGGKGSYLIRAGLEIWKRWVGRWRRGGRQQRR